MKLFCKYYELIDKYYIMLIDLYQQFNGHYYKMLALPVGSKPMLRCVVTESKVISLYLYFSSEQKMKKNVF